MFEPPKNISDLWLHPDRFMTWFFTSWWAWAFLAGLCTLLFVIFLVLLGV